MKEIEVKKLLKRACAKAGSPSAWAKEHGMSRAYVWDVLKGKRDLGDKIAEALGLEKVPPPVTTWRVKKTKRT